MSFSVAVVSCYCFIFVLCDGWVLFCAVIETVFCFCDRDIIVGYIDFLLYFRLFLNTATVFFCGSFVIECLCVFTLSLLGVPLILLLFKVCLSFILCSVWLSFLLVCFSWLLWFVFIALLLLWAFLYTQLPRMGPVVVKVVIWLIKLIK